MTYVADGRFPLGGIVSVPQLVPVLVLIRM